MKRKMLLRLAALPLVTAMGALPIASGCGIAQELGCPEFSAEANYGAALELDANVKTFMRAAAQLQELSVQMVADVGAACEDIAGATGRDSSVWDSKDGSDRVQAACAEADLGIQAVFAAAGDVSIQFLVEGGECKASITATSECYATCDVSGECTPAQLEAKCEPGKLAGSCSGECTGTCDGGTVQCNGECSATCTGTCAGDCIGECDGQAGSTAACDGECRGECRGDCSGTCSGKCTYQAVTCEGTCHGECSVEFQEPYCEGKFTPPECNLDAECKANCEASIQAEAVCTPPKVTYEVVGSATAEVTALAAVLEKHLPVFIEYAVNRGPALVAAGEALVDSGNAIVDSAGELSAKAAVCAGVAADAALVASVDIKVSVQASASVSSSASAGAQ